MRVRDGAAIPLEAITQVTVNVIRNFFAPVLDGTHTADVNTEVLETALPNTFVYALRVRDNDRRVSSLHHSVKNNFKKDCLPLILIIKIILLYMIYI